MIVGAFPEAGVLTLPAGGFHRTGKVVRASFYGDVNPFRDFPMIAELYLSGALALDSLVLSRIKLESIQGAFDSFHDAKHVNVGRTVVEFGEVEGA